MREAELKFRIKDEFNPGEVGLAAAEADARQEFSVSVSKGHLSIQSQDDHSPDEITTFVRNSVGKMVEIE